MIADDEDAVTAYRDLTGVPLTVTPSRCTGCCGLSATSRHSSLASGVSVGATPTPRGSSPGWPPASTVAASPYPPVAARLRWRAWHTRTCRWPGRRGRRGVWRPGGRLRSWGATVRASGRVPSCSSVCTTSVRPSGSRRAGRGRTGRLPGRAADRCCDRALGARSVDGHEFLAGLLPRHRAGTSSSSPASGSAKPGASPPCGERHAPTRGPTDGRWPIRRMVGSRGALVAGGSPSPDRLARLVAPDDATRATLRARRPVGERVPRCRPTARDPRRLALPAPSAVGRRDRGGDAVAGHGADASSAATFRLRSRATGPVGQGSHLQARRRQLATCPWPGATPSRIAR